CANYDGLLANGVCLPVTPTRATVGQGEAGLGWDLFPITSGIGIFLEGGVHGYDSPAHVADNAQNAEDKFAFTPYAVLGLKFGFGNIIPPPPPPPAIIPPPPPPAEIPPPPPPVQQLQDISVCVLQNGQLSNVTAQYNPATGDTTGVPTVTEGYAANATWFINNEPITINNRRYVKYGLPRVLGVTEVTSSTNFQGVPVFVEAGATGTPDVVYVPVRTGCEFQPYQVEQKAMGVRG
ncbi:MAG TPA: hypothetical protein VFJ82_15860, partial [Longimicrobium sp.]|nr:hypothetical protein [Longimicrobium sp.]